jgi:hypothetical protein
MIHVATATRTSTQMKAPMGEVGVLIEYVSTGMAERKVLN